MEISKIISYLEKWEELLKMDGANTKSMVRCDIQYLLEKIKKEQKNETRENQQEVR